MTGVWEIDERVLGSDDESGQDRDVHRGSLQDSRAHLNDLVREADHAASKGNETNPFVIAARSLELMPSAPCRASRAHTTSRDINLAGNKKESTWHHPGIKLISKWFSSR
jgi:hypothetical protein